MPEIELTHERPKADGIYLAQLKSGLRAVVVTHGDRVELAATGQDMPKADMVGIQWGALGGRPVELCDIAAIWRATGGPLKTGQTFLPLGLNEWLEEHSFSLVRREEAFPTCCECGEPQNLNDHYMLKNHVWGKVAADNEYLHLRCVEVRLGRRINLNDFTSSPINNTLRHLLREE